MARVAIDTGPLDCQDHSAPPQHAPGSELFVRFPIDLFDALLLSPMPATHKEVVLAVVRRTYGHFGKEQAPISLSLFLSMTERAERGVRNALRDLIAEGVLCRVVPATNRTAAVYRVETIIERWGRFRPSQPVADELPDKLECEHGTTPGCEQATTLECEPPTTRVDRRYSDKELPSVGDATKETGAPEILSGEPKPRWVPTSSSPVRDLVAYAARQASEANVTLSPQTKAQLGRALKDLLQGGAQPDKLHSALDALIAENRSPSHLRYILGDLERGRTHGRLQTARSTHWTTGRSENGEFI